MRSIRSVVADAVVKRAVDRDRANVSLGFAPEITSLRLAVERPVRGMLPHGLPLMTVVAAVAFVFAGTCLFYIAINTDVSNSWIFAMGIFLTVLLSVLALIAGSILYAVVLGFDDIGRHRLNHVAHLVLLDTAPGLHEIDEVETVVDNLRHIANLIDADAMFTAARAAVVMGGERFNEVVAVYLGDHNCPDSGLLELLALATDSPDAPAEWLMAMLG